jgi:hypothetical protein
MSFYRDGLGFEVLYEFNDHDGFDGTMLGHKGAAYHLEFTHKHGHTAGRAPTEDNLLAFYLPKKTEWRKAVQRIESRGYNRSKHSTGRRHHHESDNDSRARNRIEAGHS